MPVTLIKDVSPVDLDAMHDPEGYVVDDDDLIAAANAAIALGKPLLLTGEPGIGKSEFARWLAHQTPACSLHKFVVKSTTEASDLFYRFDTLARFRDAQVQHLRVDHPTSDQESRSRPISKDSISADSDSNDSTSGDSISDDLSRLHRYIRYNALGTAILYSVVRSECERLGFVSPGLGKETYESVPVEPARSVVLIDEIDKAPRDVPNDILDEIDHLQFNVPDLGNLSVRANLALRPIVVVTSNSERDLPKPFLRRCIYYHMRLSEDDAILRRIAEQRLGQRFSSHASVLGDALRLFRGLRQESALRHQPGLAELLDWLNRLSATVATEPAGPTRLAQIRDGRVTMKNTLLKDSEDQALADREWDSWLKTAGLDLNEPGSSDIRPAQPD